MEYFSENGQERMWKVKTHKIKTVGCLLINITCNHFYLSTGEKASTQGLKWPLETLEATEKTPVLLTFSQSYEN